MCLAAGAQELGLVALRTQSREAYGTRTGVQRGGGARSVHTATEAQARYAPPTIGRQPRTHRSESK